MENFERSKSFKDLRSRFYVDHTGDTPKEDTKSTKSSKRVLKTDTRSTISITTIDYDSDHNYNAERNFPDKSMDKHGLKNKSKSMTNLHQKKEFNLKLPPNYEDITASNNPTPKLRTQFKDNTLQSEKFTQKHTAESKNDDLDVERIYERIHFLNEIDIGAEMNDLISETKSMTSLNKEKEFNLKTTSDYKEMAASNRPTPKPRTKSNCSTFQSQEFTQKYASEPESDDSADKEQYERILFLSEDDICAETSDLTYETVMSFRSSDEDEEPDDRNESAKTRRVPPMTNRRRYEFEEVNEHTSLRVIKSKDTLPPLTTRKIREPVEDEATSQGTEEVRGLKVQFSMSVDDTKSSMPPKPPLKKRSQTFKNQLSRELSKRIETKPTTLPKSFRINNPKTERLQGQIFAEVAPDTTKKGGMFIISMIIKELIDTERACLNKMAHVIEHYVKYFRRLSVSPQIQSVFGNMERLYSVLKEMYSDLKTCSTVDEVGNVFLTHAEVFDLYTEYLRNKLLSYQLATTTFAKCIQDRQSQIGDPMPLEIYLLEPVQRPPRYKLLLEKLQKESSKVNEQSPPLDEAITLVSKKISEINTLRAIDSIEHCPIYLLEKGAFIRKDRFNSKREPKMVVFLFEECVVFCEEDKDNYDKYNYLNCIDMDNLSLRYDLSTNAFELSCFDKSKSEHFNKEFEFTLKASQKSTKDQWVSEIQRILWKQLQYCKEHQASLLPNPVSFKGQGDEYEIIDPSTFSGIQIHDDEEYYSLDNLSYREGSQMRGPFFDKDFFPRIEVLTDDVKVTAVDGDFTLGEAKFMKELITSEKDHLRNIELCMAVSSADISCYKFPLIQNIESIYDETTRLYLTLQQCNSRDDVARAFLESGNLFDSYTVFTKNRCSYIYVDTELKKRLYQDKSTTSDAQRKWNEYTTKLYEKPIKYKEFLEKLQILDFEESSKLLKKAIKFINRKIKETITATNIDCIHRCPIDLHNAGNFLKKGAVTLKNNCKCELFLFERLIVFCVKDENYQETYLYIDSIGMDVLSVQYAHNPLELQLRCSQQTSGGKEVKYKYDIVFSSQTSREKWLEEIYSSMRAFAKTRRKHRTNQF